MPTEKHTSEMVWTWTINELCRKVEPVAVQIIYGLSPNQKIDPFLATQTRQWLANFPAVSGKGRTDETPRTS